MIMSLLIAAPAVFVLAQPAAAWFDEGHMRVAAIAYDHLAANARTEAVRLIKLNPRYKEWADAVPKNPNGSDGDVDRYTFIRAAAWADDIKGYSDYSDDKVTAATAGQNIGYSDKFTHKYWHFKDIVFTNDGSKMASRDPVDAVTQIKLFEAALPASSGKSDDIRSYDLVWLIHLVGDAHQPLHAVSLFSRDVTAIHQAKGEPDTGDQGGNLISVTPADGRTVTLHAFWDGQFGGYSTPFGAIFDTYGFRPNKDADGHLIPIGIWPPPTSEAVIVDPDVWFEESAELAKQYAYAPPVSTWTAAQLSRDYETNARRIAEMQTGLAGMRLAAVINASFP